MCASGKVPFKARTHVQQVQRCAHLRQRQRHLRQAPCECARRSSYSICQRARALRPARTRHRAACWLCAKSHHVFWLLGMKLFVRYPRLSSAGSQHERHRLLPAALAHSDGAEPHHTSKQRLQNTVLGISRNMKMPSTHEYKLLKAFRASIVETFDKGRQSHI